MQQYYKPVAKPKEEVEDVAKIEVEDANKIINFLKAGHGIALSTKDKKEFNRLANVLREASGQPKQ
ncbi:hypothetical protein D3C78_1930470 [compost metagenome]